MYVGSGSGQAVVQDSGPASGGGTGLGFIEWLQVSRTANGVTTAPYANSGTGQYYAHNCAYDAPLTNSTGYHYFCFDANASGGGLIAYGAGGGASTLPFSFIVNGTTYAFPFVTGGIVGPGTTTVGNLAVWSNTTGTLLADGGPPGVSITMTNGEGVTTALPGAVVYVSAAATFKLAKANSSANNGAVGVAAASILPSVTGTVRTVGMVTLTTAQWDAVTGQSGGLTVGARYFLDPTTFGHLTTTAPTTPGLFVVPIGVAFSTTQMMVNPGAPIAL